MRGVALIAVVSAVAVATGTATVATASTRECGSLTVGPTALKTGSSGRGASCMLSAFRSCLPAAYELSSFGVDTVGRSTFTIARRSGGCSVTVAVTFQVVPRPAKPPTIGHCSAIVQAGSDIVATGCHGSGLAATESLTGRRTG